MQEKNYFVTCHIGRRDLHSITVCRSVYSIRHDIGFATGQGKRYDSDVWGSLLPNTFHYGHPFWEL